MNLATKAFLCATLSASLFAQSPVGMVTRQFTDASRPNWRGPGPRPEFTVVWYPAPGGTPTTTSWDQSPPPFAGSFVPTALAPDAPLSSARQRYPVVLLSHGSTSVPWSLLWLGTYLASHGYIAAAVAHHGDTGMEGAPVPQGFVLMSERAKDLSFVLDRLLEDPKFGPHIDRERIGAAGHSSGGETVIALAGGIFEPANLTKYCKEHAQSAFCVSSPEVKTKIAAFEELRKKDPAVADLYAHQNQSLRDPRIRAVFAMAPALGPGFAAADLAPVQIPVWIAAGTTDVITPAAENAERYAHLIRGAKLTLLPHVGHMLFGGECTDAGRQKLSVLCVDDPSVNRHEVLHTLAEEALAFFNTSLGADPK